MYYNDFYKFLGDKLDFYYKIPPTGDIGSLNIYRWKQHYKEYKKRETKNL